MTTTTWRTDGWGELIGPSQDISLVSSLWSYATNIKFHVDLENCKPLLFILASSSLLSKSKVLLVCEGLDTIAEIFVNDVSVGKSQNMFVRYIYDIKDALQVGAKAHV
jgi:hypothetical protein